MSRTRRLAPCTSSAAVSSRGSTRAGAGRSCASSPRSPAPPSKVKTTQPRLKIHPRRRWRCVRSPPPSPRLDGSTTTPRRRSRTSRSTSSTPGRAPTTSRRASGRSRRRHPLEPRGYFAAPSSRCRTPREATSGWTQAPSPASRAAPRAPRRCARRAMSSRWGYRAGCCVTRQPRRSRSASAS